MCPHTITLNSVQLNLVKRFHSYIHREILCINNEPKNEWFQFDPENETNGVYIVPIFNATKDVGKIETDHSTTKKAEAKNQDRNNEQLRPGDKHKDFSFCLNFERLNLQDDPDGNVVNAESGAQNIDSSGNSQDGSFRHTESGLFGIVSKFNSNRPASSDDGGNVDNDSSRLETCNIPTTTAIDANRHACDFPSVVFNSNQQVAFDFLSNIEEDLGDLLHPKDPPPQRLTNFEYYRGRVITAVYMNKPTRYTVTDIVYDMSPLSSFPDPEVAATFFDYFKQRYGLEVRGDQPLLQVKCLPRVGNGLVSKYRDCKGNERPLPDKESKR